MALEFGLEGGADTLVTEVLLAMEESAERGVNVNSGVAALQACSVTEAFWVGVDNGAWTTAPLYDCDAGVAPGVRDDDGVWTFDLTALAAEWTAADHDDSPAVVLVGAPPVDPAQGAPSFQVAFDKVAGIGLVAKVTSLPPEGTDGGDSSGTDGATDEVPTEGSFGGGGGGSGGGGGGGGLEPIDVVPLSSPDSSTVQGAGEEESSLPVTGFAPETSEAAGGQALVSAAPVSPWYSGLGVRSLALVAVALMLAYLTMIAMGGAGQPVVGGRRRGVGRALERLGAGRPPGFARIFSPGTTPGNNAVITVEDRT